MKPSVSAETANFDRVARVYRWAEYVALGTLLQRTRMHFLPQVASRKRALLFGDGDGRFLAELLSRNVELQATAVDSSKRMLHLLSARCKPYTNRLNTVHGAAQCVVPDSDTDLIVSHFFLDCLTQGDVSTLTQRIARALRPGAAWLLSDFAVPDVPWLRRPAALYIRLLYLVFRVSTGLRVSHLPDIQGAMHIAGFRRVGRHTSLFGILYTELWQLPARRESNYALPAGEDVLPTAEASLGGTKASA